jgi:hypothetical protein
MLGSKSVSASTWHRGDSRNAAVRLTLAIAGEEIMELHTPSKWTFWLSVALVVLAIIVRFAHVPGVEPYASWIEAIGYLVLVAGCIFKTT